MTGSCEPKLISEDSGSDTKACICDTDLCNIGQMETTSRYQPDTDNFDGTGLFTTNFSTVPSYQTTTMRPSSALSITAPPVLTQRSRQDRVKCHQCGSLFSGDTSAPSCDNFDVETSQQNYCQPGEACLWYSWHLSDTEVSVIRECLSTSILLGSIEDPLVVTPGCSVKDISEDDVSRVEACLCDSDLCNDNSDQSGQLIDSWRDTDNSFSPVEATTETTVFEPLLRQIGRAHV